LLSLCRSLDPAAHTGDTFAMPRFVTTAAVEGMRTAHCVRAVFTALAGVPGITRADVQVGRIEVDHDGRATPDALRAAIAIAGYELGETTEERQRTLPLL
jgi:copper chaperone CopZ